MHQTRQRDVNKPGFLGTESHFGRAPITSHFVSLLAHAESASLRLQNMPFGEFSHAVGAFLRFQRWVAVRKKPSVPKGRLKSGTRSAVPPGLGSRSDWIPTLKPQKCTKRANVT